MVCMGKSTISGYIQHQSLRPSLEEKRSSDTFKSSYTPGSHKFHDRGGSDGSVEHLQLVGKNVKRVGRTWESTQVARVIILVKTNIFAVYGALRRCTLCATAQLCQRKEKGERMV
jgi:hypothetical protein